MQLAHPPIAASRGAWHTVHMLDAPHFNAQDLHGLCPDALAAVAQEMFQRIAEQSSQLAQRDRHIAEQSKHIDSQAQAIK